MSLTGLSRESIVTEDVCVRSGRDLQGCEFLLPRPLPLTRSAASLARPDSTGAALTRRNCDTGAPDERWEPSDVARAGPCSAVPLKEDN